MTLLSSDDFPSRLKEAPHIFSSTHGAADITVTGFGGSLLSKQWLREHNHGDITNDCLKTETAAG